VGRKEVEKRLEQQANRSERCRDERLTPYEYGLLSQRDLIRTAEGFEDSVTLPTQW
jgi:hypothetical protein